MDKEIIKKKVDAFLVDAFLEDPCFSKLLDRNAAYALAQHIANFVEQENRKDSASIIANARVYPTLDNKPRPWVSIYGHRLSFDSIVTSWKQLEEIGLKDDDEVVITVKKA